MGCSSYDVQNYGLQKEDAYLDFMWNSTPEYKNLSFKVKYASFTPEELSEFNRVKGILDAKGIQYTDYELVAHMSETAWITESLTCGEAIVGHAAPHGWNHLLRRENARGDEGELWQKILDKGFEIVPPTQEAETVYRGICGNAAIKESSKAVEEILTSKKGDIITDKAFAYSSYKKNIAMNFGGPSRDSRGGNVIMKIQVPKGARVSRAKHSEQSEMLFPRNAQFKILEEAKNANGINEVLVEYIIPS